MSIVLGAYYINIKPKAELVPLDIEIERTLRNLKKVKVVKKAVIAE